MSLRIAFFFLATFLTTLMVTGSARATNQEIRYSNQVPQNEVDLLNEDLNRPLKFTDDIPDFKNLMGLKDLNFSTLRAWLADRVGFVIAESEDPADRLSILQENYAYQNPTLFPDIEKPSPDGPQKKVGSDLDPQKTGTIMTNVGTNIYLHGKKTKQLLGYAFNSEAEKENLSVKSPRIGIIQIGEGLFAKRMNDDTDRSFSNSIYRLAILFHEAHHSDGNGKSLGFIHALCPKDSPYYNTLSCDREANGPYTVEAEFIRHAVIACHDEKNCDEDETERLSFIGVDALDRVLSDVVLDPTPEGL